MELPLSMPSAPSWMAASKLASVFSGKRADACFNEPPCHEGNEDGIFGSVISRTVGGRRAEDMPHDGPSILLTIGQRPRAMWCWRRQYLEGSLCCP